MGRFGGAGAVMAAYLLLGAATNIFAAGVFVLVGGEAVD